LGKPGIRDRLRLGPKLRVSRTGCRRFKAKIEVALGEEFQQTDLGRSSFLWLNGESGSRRERFCARGGRPRRNERGSPAGWGSFSHTEGEKDPRQPFRSRARSKPVPFVCRSTSGPDTFANLGLSTFTGGVGSQFSTYDVTHRIGDQVLPWDGTRKRGTRWDGYAERKFPAGQVVPAGLIKTGPGGTGPSHLI
jgi:hypothetical protein